MNPLKIFKKNKNSENEILFDEKGQFIKAAFSEGKWTKKQTGDNTYYSQTAKSLLRASEILKKINHIPPLTYFTIKTPDGSLGRDKLGFYSDGPLRVENIVIESSHHKSQQVECLSLKNFDDSSYREALSMIAYLKQSGEYAKLILLMKCGACGYESPVETQKGTINRECYCCGTKNVSERSTITVFFGGKMVEI